MTTSTTDTSLVDSFRTIAQAMRELEETLLKGWPFKDSLPTDHEAEQIQCTFHELSLHLPALDDDRRWLLAGNIIARFRRDVG